MALGGAPRLDGYAPQSQSFILPMGDNESCRSSLVIARVDHDVAVATRLPPPTAQHI